MNGRLFVIFTDNFFISYRWASYYGFSWLFHMKFILTLPFSARNPTCNPTWSITHIAFIYIMWCHLGYFGDLGVWTCLLVIGPTTGPMCHHLLVFGAPAIRLLWQHGNLLPHRPVRFKLLKSCGESLVNPHPGPLLWSFGLWLVRRFSFVDAVRPWVYNPGTCSADESFDESALVSPEPSVFAAPLTPRRSHLASLGVRSPS